MCAVTACVHSLPCLHAHAPACTAQMASWHEGCNANTGLAWYDMSGRVVHAPSLRAGRRGCCALKGAGPFDPSSAQPPRGCALARSSHGRIASFCPTPHPQTTHAQQPHPHLPPRVGCLALGRLCGCLCRPSPRARGPCGCPSLPPSPRTTRSLRRSPGSCCTPTRWPCMHARLRGTDGHHGHGTPQPVLQSCMHACVAAMPAEMPLACLHQGWWLAWLVPAWLRPRLCLKPCPPAHVACSCHPQAPWLLAVRARTEHVRAAQAAQALRAVM